MACRLCLKKDKILIPVFDECGMDTKCIAATVANYIGVHLHVNDKISSKICCSCWASIDNFHKFCSTVSDKQKHLSDFGLGGMPVILLLDRSEVPGDVKMQFVEDDCCAPDSVVLKTNETDTDTADESVSRSFDEYQMNKAKLPKEQQLEVGDPSPSNIGEEGSTSVPATRNITHLGFAYPSSSRLRTKRKSSRPVIRRETIQKNSFVRSKTEINSISFSSKEA